MMDMSKYPTKTDDGATIEYIVHEGTSGIAYKWTASTGRIKYYAMILPETDDKSTMDKAIALCDEQYRLVRKTSEDK